MCKAMPGEQGSAAGREAGAGSFRERIYTAARRIPEGKVATYGLLAFLAGSPRASRAVGSVMAACGDPSVPCHRVVDRFGGTKPAFDRYAPGTQRALLEAEGVAFTPEGTVDLALCLWNPSPGPEDERGDRAE